MTNFEGCNTNYECINKNPVSCFCVAYFMKFCEWDIPVVCGEVRKILRTALCLCLLGYTYSFVFVQGLCQNWRYITLKSSFVYFQFRLRDD